MLERALDNCKQDPNTWDYLYRNEALAMAAEIERLDREKDEYALLAAQRQTENARLSERLKWYENYVKACDNEIRRARGVMPADVPRDPCAVLHDMDEFGRCRRCTFVQPSL